MSPSSTRSVSVLLLLVLAQILADAAMPQYRQAIARETASSNYCRKVRFATFNTSLNRNKAGQLLKELRSKRSAQAANISHILQLIRPDVLLLNEFDYEAGGIAVQAFQDNYLAVPQSPELEPLRFEHVFVASVNTGIPSGRDFNHDGKSGGPQDCFGYGFHPGQYGMVLLSQFPIDTRNARTFQHFLWKDMPGALLPTDPGTQQPWYSQADLRIFRLSSKSHWDVPIIIPLHGLATPQHLDAGQQPQFVNAPETASSKQDVLAKPQISSPAHEPEQADLTDAMRQDLNPEALQQQSKRVHMLLHHPTPPAFDGPEKRNMLRNHDEIRFWADYVGCGSCAEPSSMGGKYMYDDSGAYGGLKAGSSFVIMGDHNADPLDGDSYPGAIQQLLNCCQINSSFVPTSEGGREAGNRHHKDRTPPETKTSSFDLRVDYVLPSRDVKIIGGAVWWPTRSSPLSELLQASDHRPVFLDVQVCARPQ